MFCFWSENLRTHSEGPTGIAAILPFPDVSEIEAKDFDMFFT